MTIDTMPSPLADWTEFLAGATLLANEASARAANSKQVAALSAWANSEQQAEHVRGLVAATVSQISTDASPAARERATNWQNWALGLADGLVHPVN